MKRSKRRSSIVCLVFCLLLTGVLIGAEEELPVDSTHTWIVSTDVNDPCYPSDWHPRGYPLDLYYSAESVSAVLACAEDGDVIYLFPGTYNEAVDMSSLCGIRLEGIGKGAKISCSTDNTIKLGDECELRNLYVICDCNSGCSAISAEEAEDVVVTDCIAEHQGPGRGIYFDDCNNTTVQGSIVRSAKYGIYIEDCNKSNASHKISDTQVVCTDCGPSGCGVYLNGEGQVNMESCLVRVVADNDCNSVVAVDSKGTTLLNISGSSIYSGYNATTGLGSKSAIAIACAGTAHVTGTLITTQDEVGTQYSIYTTGIVYASASGFDVNDVNDANGVLIHTAGMGQ